MIEKTIKAESRGGKRKNAGRKSRFKEPTKGVKFMCPISKEAELKKYVNKKLATWVKYPNISNETVINGQPI